MIALLVAAALGSPCAAPATGYRPGAVVSGEVVRVVDGDSLWLAMAPGPEGCIKIRIADFYAPEVRDPGGSEATVWMAALAAGRRLTCTAERSASNPSRTYSYDRLVAVCRVGEWSLGDLMRSAGVEEGGKGRQ